MSRESYKDACIPVNFGVFRCLVGPTLDVIIWINIILHIIMLYSSLQFVMRLGVIIEIWRWINQSLYNDGFLLTQCWALWHYWSPHKNTGDILLHLISISSALMISYYHIEDNMSYTNVQNKIFLGWIWPKQEYVPNEYHTEDNKILFFDVHCS